MPEPSCAKLSVVFLKIEREGVRVSGVEPLGAEPLGTSEDDDGVGESATAGIGAGWRCRCCS
jgi:hypothetical protein